MKAPWIAEVRLSSVATVHDAPLSSATRVLTVNGSDAVEPRNHLWSHHWPTCHCGAEPSRTAPATGVPGSSTGPGTAGSVWSSEHPANATAIRETAAAKRVK